MPPTSENLLKLEANNMVWYLSNLIYLENFSHFTFWFIDELNNERYSKEQTGKQRSEISCNFKQKCFLNHETWSIFQNGWFSFQILNDEWLWITEFNKELSWISKSLNDVHETRFASWLKMTLMFKD